MSIRVLASFKAVIRGDLPDAPKITPSISMLPCFESKTKFAPAGKEEPVFTPTILSLPRS